MARMSITVNGDGFEVTNPAGTAQYDAWGSRATVNGVPEYFPLQLSVSGMASFETTAPHGGGYSASIQIEADTSELEKKLDEINNLIKNSAAFEFINGQVFIKPATISRNEITVDKFSLYSGVDSIISEIIKNAVANQRDAERLENDIQKVVQKAIVMNCRPGGAIYRAINKG